MYQARSEKAKVSAAANKNFSHLGRHALARLTHEVVEERWSELMLKYPNIVNITCPRSKKHLASHVTKNKKTKMWEFTKSGLSLYPELVSKYIYFKFIYSSQLF